MISEKLRDALLQFRRDRDWEQFHSPRNLATALSVEASELLENFQWLADADVARVASERREQIAEEIADIAIILTYLVHDLSLDLESTVAHKLERNAEKYPVAKARGSSPKYDRL